MPKILRPDLIVGSIYEIDLPALREKGIGAVIADLDNTLVPWNATEVDERMVEWLLGLREAGLELAIVSNNFPARVEEVSSRLGVIAVARAVKPRRRAFLRLASRLGLAPCQVCVIGDQLFTDIIGGNRSGMYTVLVTPLDKREFIGTKFVRLLERVLLRTMN
jgi:HAD superfamily phosphatase (TIGR01668 family)